MVGCVSVCVFGWMVGRLCVFVCLLVVGVLVCLFVCVWLPELVCRLLMCLFVCVCLFDCLFARLCD